MKNILDLCLLNQIEENGINSPAPDRDAALRSLDWKRRNLMVKIAAETVPASDEVMQDHRERNYEGVTP